MNLPRRRKAPRMGVRETPQIRCPSHLKWVRGNMCIVPGCENRNIEAAHVRTGTDGGMGVKPSDIWVNAMCGDHHAEQHRIGEPAFERKYGVKLKASAERFARYSPHKWRWKQETEGD